MKKFTLSALIIATTTMQPVWGSRQDMSYKSLKSEMEKIDADISVMSGNLAYARSRGLRNEAMHFITVNSPTSRSSSRPALPDIVGDVTTRPITPVDQGTIKAPDTDMTVEITGNGFFIVDSTTRLLAGGTIDPVAELTNCQEAQEAHNRIAGEYRRRGLVRQNLIAIRRLMLRSLRDDAPHSPTTITRRQMNRALNELLSNPPQLRHIVPPTK